jgi:hypothetical protein
MHSVQPEENVSHLEHFWSWHRLHFMSDRTQPYVVHSEEQSSHDELLMYWLRSQVDRQRSELPAGQRVQPEQPEDWTKFDEDRSWLLSLNMNMKPL